MKHFVPARGTLAARVSVWYASAPFKVCRALGISLAVGRLTLDQLGQVRILDPQPLECELLPASHC